MDYEKAYKEALERAKSLIGKEGLTEGSYPNRNACETIFPELAESEDERVNEEIRNFLIDMECKREWIAYLEKRKDCGGKTLIRDSGESACSYIERCLTPEMRKVWYEACAEIKESLHIPETCKENGSSFTDTEWEKALDAEVLNAYSFLDKDKIMLATVKGIARHFANWQREQYKAMASIFKNNEE